MRSFIQGIKWTVAQQVANMATNYLSMILLAWYLSPSDFGLVALSTVLVGLFEVLNGFGIPQLIIKNQVTHRPTLGYYLVISLFLSIILALLCIFSALAYVSWYSGKNQDDLFGIIAASSVGLVFNSTNAIYNAQYHRDLDFKTPIVFALISTVLGNVLAVGYVMAKGGYWALVVRNIAPLVLLTLGFVFFSAHRPLLNVRHSFLPQERRFTFWLSGNQLINYVSRNLDYVVIGRFFDIGIVGQYSLAYRLMLFPMKFLSARVQAVLYPTLVAMKPDPAGLLSFYTKVVSNLGFAVFPLMGLASVTAPVWMPWMFDMERYDMLLPLMQWLILAGAFQAVTSPIGTLYMVHDMVRLMATYSTLSASVFLLGYGAGAWSGNIVVFAMIYVLLSVLMNFFASNYLPLSRLGYPFTAFLQQTLEPLVPAITAFGAVWLFLGATPTYHQGAVMGVAVLLYGLVYILAYFCCFRVSLRNKYSKLKGLLY
ncbi:MAG: hypothetical protein RL181_831 [Bacteroidota bacterium]|jgi:PST family polysaccharide transporter